MGCSSGSEESGATVDIDPYAFILIDEDESVGEMTVKLSDFVENFSVVPFENSDSALFRPWKPVVSENYIAIVQNGMHPVMLFDRQGTFIGQVGRVGQGPGEYQAIYDVAIDESHGSIYVAPWFTPHPILQYNLKGQFVAEHAVYGLRKPALFSNDDGTLSITGYDVDESVTAMTLSTDTDSIKSIYYPSLSVKLYNEAKDDAPGLDNEMWAYKNTNECVFMVTSNDTLYVYNPVTIP